MTKTNLAPKGHSNSGQTELMAAETQPQVSDAQSPTVTGMEVEDMASSEAELSVAETTGLQSDKQGSDAVASSEDGTASTEDLAEVIAGLEEELDEEKAFSGKLLETLRELDGKARKVIVRLQNDNRDLRSQLKSLRTRGLVNAMLFCMSTVAFLLYLITQAQ